MKVKNKQLPNNSEAGKYGSRFAALHGVEGETSGTKKDGVNAHECLVGSNNDGMIEEEFLADKVNDEVIKEREKHGEKSNNDIEFVSEKAPMGGNDENKKENFIVGGITAGGKGVAHSQGANHGKQSRKHVDNKGRDKNQSHLASCGKTMLRDKNTESMKRVIEFVFEKEKNMSFLEDNHVNIHNPKRMFNLDLETHFNYIALDDATINNNRSVVFFPNPHETHPLDDTIVQTNGEDPNNKENQSALQDDTCTLENEDRRRNENGMEDEVVRETLEMC